MIEPQKVAPEQANPPAVVIKAKGKGRYFVSRPKRIKANSKTVGTSDANFGLLEPVSDTNFWPGGPDTVCILYTQTCRTRHVLY